jgi:hypothetical protein
VCVTAIVCDGERINGKIWIILQNIKEKTKGFLRFPPPHPVFFFIFHPLIVIRPTVGNYRVRPDDRQSSDERTSQKQTRVARLLSVSKISAVARGKGKATTKM